MQNLEMMPVDAFTISSNNYLGMARVLADSYLAHHPGARVFTCLVDRLSPEIDYGGFPFQIIPAQEIGINGFANFAFRYNILELNTAVKPFVFKHLRDRFGIDRAFYFDPDILIHDHLAGLEQALDQHLAVLTPHLTQPIDNRCRPPERVIGMCGIYNLGFLGLRLDRRTSDFLDWWCDRLDRYCFVDLSNGMFVDQSWMDFAPAYLESVAIMRDPIYNIAYWNLPHRFPAETGGCWQVDGRRVGFVHFSGVDLEEIHQISRHQDRIDLTSRPELRPLFEGYADLVHRSGQHELRNIPYAFGRFSGTAVAIPADARRALQEVDPCGRRWPDPFAVDCEDSFLSWLATPIRLENGISNRLALYLWQYNENLQVAFPRIDDEDLPRFAEWFVASGGAEYGLDDTFVEPLRRVLASSVFRGGWKRIAGISLSDPRTATHWLNEPVDSQTNPVLTRLATAIFDARPDIQARFPDPLGRDRREFAYWVVRFGSRDYGLDRRLLEPISRGLPLRSRISVWLRNALRRGRGAEAVPRRLEPARVQGPGGCPEVRLDDGRVLPTGTALGVNLMGYFEGASGTASFAPGIREALAEAEIPHVVVPLDHDLPDLMTTARIRFESGTPYPVTVLALPTDQWRQAVRKLPSGSRAGGILVGYCCDPADSVEPIDLTAVDEVWVPTHEEAHRVVRVSPVPVRPVAPPVSNHTGKRSESRFRLDGDRTWFLVVDSGRGREDEMAVSRALECLRRLHRDESSPVGLLLLLGSAGSTATSEVRHLPVQVHDGPITPGVVREALDVCAGLLDVGRHPILRPVAVEAAVSGKVIIACRWEELTDVVPGGASSNVIRIQACDASSDAIVNAVSAMREFVGERTSAVTRSADEQNRAWRDAWRQEAFDQWRREIFRAFNGDR